MLINDIVLFLAGLFFANGIPHFIQGISGKNFHNPFLHRLMPAIPSPLFNVLWGLFNFCLAIFLLSGTHLLGFLLKREALFFAAGFAFAAIGLSIFFNRPVKS
jgi:hypothetical protein